MQTTVLTEQNPGTSHDIDAIIGQIDERGYTVIPDLISAEEADEARGVLEELLRAEQMPAHLENKSQRVARIAVKHQVFRDLMCHPTIVTLWQKWLGADMVCSTWTGNTIYPGHSGIHWHADFPYWAMQQPWPAGNLTGQTIWMLDDFTDENGGTGVVPYSHLKLERPDAEYEWRDDAEIATGRRGSVVVLHGAIWHTSRPNNSEASRSALLGMYIRPALTQMENMRGQLAEIEQPSELLSQLMGANAYQSKDIGA